MPPTADFVDIHAYMGRWYEIQVSAAFRKQFESGDVCTTANYTLNGDGTVKVVNSGNEGSPTGRPNTAIGKAKQVSGGKLEVSFFGPFYGPYWIIDLEGDKADGYSTSLVYSCTSGLFKVEDMWILSRTPDLPASTQQAILSKAAGFGIDVSALNMSATAQPKTCKYPTV